MSANQYSYKTLCVIQTDTIIGLIEQAKQSLIAVDYNFAAEVELAEKRNHDPSVVVRRAIRDFKYHIESITDDQWGRYFELYNEHRAGNNGVQTHLRIEESGKRELREIGNYISLNDEIYSLVSVKDVGGVRVPFVMIIIFALAWEVERLTVKA